MCFAIQTCNPSIVTSREMFVEDVAEAIETVFFHRTEDAMLFWNGVIIPINYKYDLSVIIDDIVVMLQNLLGKERGTCEVHFGSNSFLSIWNLKWQNNQLEISAEWHSVAGDLNAVLTRCSNLEMPLDDFIAEWKVLLKLVIDALITSRCQFAERDTFEALVQTEALIQQNGCLYRN